MSKWDFCMGACPLCSVGDGMGTWEFGVRGKIHSCSYFIADDARLPQTFELPTNRET
jgi:hypothetical protein